MAVLATKEKSDLAISIREIIDHFEFLFNPSRGFFLKPNIVFPVPGDSGEVTRPAVVRAVIEALRWKFGDVDIVIGEGTAAGTDPVENFEISGFSKLARDLGVRLIDLDGAPRVAIPWKYGELRLPAVALERNHINLPILKLSAAATFSGGMKNIKGLLSTDMKKKFHRLGLHEPIAALARVIKPDLTVLDGHNFFPKDNVFLSGDNPCEIDVAAMRMLNVNEPEYLKIAVVNGEGSYGFAIENESLLNYKRKKVEELPYKRFLNMRLWSNPRACSACRQTLRTMKNIKARDLSTSCFTYLRLAGYAVLGADFIFGSNPTYNESASRVVCIGDCTKTIAIRKGHLHIPGCPPTRENVIQALSHF